MLTLVFGVAFDLHSRKKIHCYFLLIVITFNNFTYMCWSLYIAPTKLHMSFVVVCTYVYYTASTFLFYIFLKLGLLTNICLRHPCATQSWPWNPMAILFDLLLMRSLTPSKYCDLSRKLSCAHIFNIF